MLTESAWQTVGPFFHSALPWEGGETIAGPDAAGERVRLAGRILDGNGAPTPDAMVEAWQSDAAGRFHHPDSDPADPHVKCFGRAVCNAEGRFVLDTIRPGRVPGPGNTQQAPHIAISVFGRGLSGRLVTRVYFAGDPANDDDPVLGLVDEAERRATLMAHPDPAVPHQWLWTIRMQGDAETVFFSV